MVAQDDRDSLIAGTRADTIGGAPVRAHVVELSGRAAKVHEALTRLQGAAVSWTGGQREIRRVSGYKSAHTVGEALVELEEAGLLLRQAQGNGRIHTFYLRASTPEGEPYLIRTAPVFTGRDVVRSAGSRRFTPLDTYAIDDAPPMQEPMQSPPDRDAPSLSSSSSSSAQVHDAASPAASHGAWVPVSPAEVDAEGHLRALGIDPESDIVIALAKLNGEPAADTWKRIELRRTSSPEFVRLCLDTTARKYPEGAAVWVDREAAAPKPARQYATRRQASSWWRPFVMPAAIVCAALLITTRGSR